MKSPEKLYSLNNNGCVGFLFREKEMKKLSKILARQKREIYEFLYQNIEKLEAHSWTLAYPDEKQHIVKYYNPNEDKHERLKLFKQMNNRITYEPVVMISDNDEIAKEEYIEWWESENENQN